MLTCRERLSLSVPACVSVSVSVSVSLSMVVASITVHVLRVEQGRSRTLNGPVEARTRRSCHESC